MAQPASIVWSEPPYIEYRRLSLTIRSEINRRLTLLKLFPKMYQVETNGEWEGLRRIPVRWYRLYYTYWDETHTIYIDALVAYREG